MVKAAAPIWRVPVRVCVPLLGWTVKLRLPMPVVAEGTIQEAEGVAVQVQPGGPVMVRIPVPPWERNVLGPPESWKLQSAAGCWMLTREPATQMVPVRVLEVGLMSW